MLDVRCVAVTEPPDLLELTVDPVFPALTVQPVLRALPEPTALPACRALMAGAALLERLAPPARP
jgi:hypothetical protein